MVMMTHDIKERQECYVEEHRMKVMDMIMVMMAVMTKMKMTKTTMEIRS